MNLMMVAVMAAVISACSVGEVPPRMPPDGGGDSSTAIDAAGLHDQLTNCPSWTSVQLHPAYCERACEPKPANTAAGCPGATSPTVGDTQACTSTVSVDGAFGCCVMVGGPYRVLFYDCPT